MKQRVRLGFLVATLIGLAITVWLLRHTGLETVIDAAARMGLGGFALYCLYSLGVFVPLGAAWACSAPPLALGPNLFAFSWARAVREAASDFLPFSQLGGLVVGARTLVLRGHPAALVNASLLVDLTTEMASQVVLTVLGIAGFLVLRSNASQSDLLGPILLGTALMLGIMIAFFAAQRWALGFGITMLGRLGLATGPGLTGIRSELARIYACRRRVLEALFFNFAAWLMSAAGAWVALKLMGADLPIMHVLVLESLIFVLRSVAFAIPSAIGVQEAAYVVLGPLLGLPPAAALALSLAKRARELAIGLPALAIWQLGEVKALRTAARST